MPRISSQYFAIIKSFLTGLGLTIAAIAILGAVPDMSAGQNSSVQSFASCNPMICDPYPEPSLQSCETRGDCDPLPTQA